jgi:hypothetical protein
MNNNLKVLRVYEEQCNNLHYGIQNESDDNIKTQMGLMVTQQEFNFFLYHLIKLVFYIKT